MMLAFYFVCVLITADIVAVTSWKYHDEGHWGELCQKGTQQSPISLQNSKSELSEFSPFSFYGYGQNVQIVVKNNGHSAEVRLKKPEHIPEVSGGGLSDVYQLDHLHFHWQSEHTMEKIRFPLEMHLVHYAKKYSSLQEALKYPGNVAVLAVLFDLSPDDVEDFDPLLVKVTSLENQVNVPEEMDTFVIKNYLPKDLAGFYRYDGSLTTPNCTEGVIWTVFTNTIPISRQQVEIFENIHTDDNTVLKDNFRSLQPLNGRKVLIKVSPLRSLPGSAAINAFSSGILIFVLLVQYLTNIIC